MKLFLSFFMKSLIECGPRVKRVKFITAAPHKQDGTTTSEFLRRMRMQ